MKSCCSPVIDCNNCCETCECECNKQPCCGYFDICVKDCRCQESYEVRINKCEWEKIVKSLKCELNDGTYKIIDSIAIGPHLYIFVGAKRKSKNNTLCVIYGKIDIDKKLENCCSKKDLIKNTLKIQMCYNIYCLIKECCYERNRGYNLKIVQVSYNPYDDLFVVLFAGCCETLIGTIEHLESIHSIGTSLKLVNNDETCCPLILDYKPVSICAVCKHKYKFVGIDCNSKCQKTLHLCF